MLQELNLMKELRSEVQDFREEVLFQHKSFMEELALKKTEQNTESLLTAVSINKLYKEGFSLLNEAKSIVCSNELDFVKKAELLDNSQKLMGIANEMVEFLIEEEMPTRFFKNNREGLLDIKGLLKLMNQGKFNAVDSIIKDFIPHIDVNKEILDNAFELFEGISLREVKSEEDLIDLISKFAEKQKEMISYLPVQSDEDLYGLAEKESEEGSDGFILDEPNEDLDLDLDVEFNDDFFGLTEKQSDEELYGLAEKQSNEDSDGFILDEPNEDCLDKKHEELERKMKDIWSTRFSVAEKDQLNHTYSKNSALAL